ncbi:DUF917 domain-containing protein [Gordonia westfalica]|uniref:DUF917 domain-containing protein n=1 Tax=Gordonia westfalica TaxID=158898 RepID=A0ABU2H059_9ACTN|nr:DUF917 domain-containing protein [Gordonia westfalica]MDS1116742.1 DUF917 domain-containing protein [Gordonia westfalica]
MQQLSIDDIEDIARGAGILGTGGGGDPYIGKMLLAEEYRRGSVATLMDPDELADDALVVASAFMGAPSVVMERIPSGDEAVEALRVLERRLGRPVTAVVPMECGGLNSMIPLLVAAKTGIPIVDADGMGRAFPELQMETFGVYGVSGSPIAICDDRGHSVIVDTGSDNVSMERHARGVTIRMGGVAYIAEYPMSGADLKRTAIPRTLTLAQSIGKAVATAKSMNRSPLEAVTDCCANSIYGHARLLLEGKVVDVARATSGGFVSGTAEVRAFDDSRSVTLTFQNEHLIAREGDRVLAIVPDLVSVLDIETGLAINTESLRFGQRVHVVGISTPPIMRTPEALQVFGPAAFGLTEPWTPLEDIGVAAGALP